MRSRQILQCLRSAYLSLSPYPGCYSRASSTAVYVRGWLGSTDSRAAEQLTVHKDSKITYITPRTWRRLARTRIEGISTAEPEWRERDQTVAQRGRRFFLSSHRAPSLPSSKEERGRGARRRTHSCFMPHAGPEPRGQLGPSSHRPPRGRPFGFIQGGHALPQQRMHPPSAILPEPIIGRGERTSG